MNERRAKVLRVVDADTMLCDVDLGFGVRVAVKVRVLGLESWERASADRWLAESVRAWVRGWLPADRSVLLTPKGRDKFGRWLCDVARPSDGACLADDAIAAGLGWSRPSSRRVARPE